MSFKTELLLTIASGSNIFLSHIRALPLPYWLLLNSFPGKSDSSLINCLYKLESDDLIQWSYLGRSKYIKITEKGKKRLFEKIQYFNFLREIWDYRFRVVLFDIPEIERKLRTELRAILTSLGFVMWQRSVFITPHIVEDDFNKKMESLGLGLLEKSNLLLVYKVINTDMNDLVWKLWRLEGLNERYRDFITQADDLLKRKVSNSRSWVLDCQKLRFSYYSLLCNEPFLPKELLGQRYLFGSASSYYEKLGEKLVEVLENL